MNIFENIVLEIKKSSHIILTSHKSPDGDSIGSSVGLLEFIKKLGKSAVICHPDVAPKSLKWLVSDPVLLMTDHTNEVKKEFDKADLVFCLDYNGTDRVGEEMQSVLENFQGKKIMIDHHLNPQQFADIMVSEPEASSTAQLIVELIIGSGNEELLDNEIGTPLYLGILTDTGNFRFPIVKARTHELLAILLAAGVEHHLIHERINDNNNESRMRLQGFAMSEKMMILEENKVAIVPLSEQEMTKYDYKKGDTDGIANMALSIEGMKAAILLSEKDGKIKISFRSKGDDNPVNQLASEHFDGGGHANASGGISDLSLEKTIEKMKRLVVEYFPVG